MIILSNYRKKQNTVFNEKRFNSKNKGEKMKVKKLKHFETIINISINSMFEAKILPNKLVSLNQNVKCKVRNSGDMPESGNIAVKIVKVSLPMSIECEYIQGDYEVENESTDISSFTIEDIGKKSKIYCKVIQVSQTSGPTLFTLFDGTGSIVSKAFVGPGKRAFPELNEEDVIMAYIELKERDGNLEGELLKFNKLDDAKSRQLVNKIQRLKDEKSNPSEIPFLVKSEILDKLKPKIINVAKEIKKAILENRPIILRHHADVDGYAGAIALERAILPLILKQHNDTRAQWINFKRAPSKAPFYELLDVTKDLAFSLTDMARHGAKAPLVLLVDNGGTEEDLLAIKKCKIYDAKIVVIDHHYPGKLIDGKSMIDPYVDAYVSPHLVEGGYPDYTAGMLATEVARFVNNDVDENVLYLPALAGVGDRSKCVEFDQYLEIAKEHGYTLDYLKDIAICVDFEAHYLKFIESRGMVNDLLGANKDKQKKLVSLLRPEIQLRYDEQLKVVKHYVKVIEKSDKLVVELPSAKVGFRGDFPAIGRITGMAHDYICEKNEGKGVVTLGIGPDFLTIRANDHVKNFNVNLLIDQIKEKIPYSFANGGGHEHAGSIKFVEASRDEVLEFVRGNI